MAPVNFNHEIQEEEKQYQITTDHSNKGLLEEEDENQDTVSRVTNGNRAGDLVSLFSAK